MEKKIKCIQTHILKTKIVNLGSGKTETKQFKIIEGTTGTCTLGKRSINTRIKLDNPLFATNEKDNEVCSIFVSTSSISNRWALND